MGRSRKIGKEVGIYLTPKKKGSYFNGYLDKTSNI